MYLTLGTIILLPHIRIIYIKYKKSFFFFARCLRLKFTKKWVYFLYANPLKRVVEFFGASKSTSVNMSFPERDTVIVDN